MFSPAEVGLLRGAVMQETNDPAVLAILDAALKRLQETFRQAGNSMRDDLRVNMDRCSNPTHIRDLRAASVMAAATDVMVHRGLLDRTPIQDARLLYGDGQPSTAEEATRLLGVFLPGWE